MIFLRLSAAIGRKVGVDEYYAEVSPENKARIREREKEDGRKVIMIGNGINGVEAFQEANSESRLSQWPVFRC